MISATYAPPTPFSAQLITDVAIVDSHIRTRHIRARKAGYVCQGLVCYLSRIVDQRQETLHGLVGIFISILLILSAVNGSRPAAIVALTFNDIEIMMAPSVEYSGQGTILVNVNLDKTKN